MTAVTPSESVDDPCVITGTIKALADLLPAIIRVDEVCSEAGFEAESIIATGLAMMLAALVEAETLPDSSENAAARAVLCGSDVL